MMETTTNITTPELNEGTEPTTSPVVTPSSVKAPVDIEEIDNNDLASRSEIRENSKRGRETARIPFEQIKPRAGFNVREDYGDIEALAKSIMKNGLINPLIVDMLSDGTALLTDGYRRHRAYMKIKEWGYPVVDVECFINKSNTTEEERLTKMFITQDNKKLEPMEVANIFSRLINLGYTVDSLAEQFGWSVTNVRNYLNLATEPTVIKNMVRKKTIKPTVAIELNKKVKNPNDRIKFLQDKEKDGKGVTMKDIKSLDRTSPTSVAKAVDDLEKITTNYHPAVKGTVDKIVKYLRGDLQEEDLAEINIAPTAAAPVDGVDGVLARLAKLEATAGFFSVPSQEKLTIVIEYLKGNYPEDRLLDFGD